MKKLLRMIRKHTGKIACVNDSNHGIDFEKAKAEINAKHLRKDFRRGLHLSVNRKR